MIPESIPIQRIEDYHTEHVGKYGEDLQYMGFAFFAESNQKRPIGVLHLFDATGKHIESKIWEDEKMYIAEDSLIEAISTLRNSKPGDIKVSPFSVRLNKLLIGLIARSDGQCLEYKPYGLAFFPPWDGTYDT